MLCRILSWIWSRKETIEVELPVDVIFALAMMAHERDITLNKLIEKVLLDFIESGQELQLDEEVRSMQKERSEVPREDA